MNAVNTLTLTDPAQSHTGNHLQITYFVVSLGTMGYFLKLDSLGSSAVAHLAPLIFMAPKLHASYHQQIHIPSACPFISLTPVCIIVYCPFYITAFLDLMGNVSFFVATGPLRSLL
ncbi:hypothetical protein XENTR_v10002548 [Xenopus tropicalis]|nr:hypothetical protein XENTR_v10002548 [Xenopus tropicalis]